MTKINFKQPKYVFPLIVFVPLCYLAYIVTEMVGDDSENQVATDQINANLPEARTTDSKDKLDEMQLRFRDDDSYTAVGGLGEDVEEEEKIEHGYSEDELDRIDAEQAERIRQQKQLIEMQRSLAESRKHINSYSDTREYDSDDDYLDEMENLRRRSKERERMYRASMGLPDEEAEERAMKQRQDSIQRAREIEREKNRPVMVLKSQDANSEKFNTVAGMNEALDAPLIRAMIDKTTKAHEGTRIRFKLLDDIIIKDVKLPKGSYLYGTVTGFGQQRVKAAITSILIGNKFIKVNLSVFDNDGMEGFYVPESAFRELLKEAGASTIQQNINFDSGYGGSGFNAESLAMQALQNIYNSATSAISKNIRRNKAKIKYNTIVYLINSQDAR